MTTATVKSDAKWKLRFEIFWNNTPKKKSSETQNIIPVEFFSSRAVSAGLIKRQSSHIKYGKEIINPNKNAAEKLIIN